LSDKAVAVAVPAGYRNWRSVASLAIDAISSAHSKRAHEKALKDFLAWYSAEARPPLSRAIVQQYRSVLESASLAPASINLRLSAIRKLAAEAAENGLLDRSVTQGIASLKGVRQSGARAGNWLSREQARDLLAQPEIETTEGKRDRAILAVLLGCALRRSELAALKGAHIQQRDGRWVFVDLVGKGKRIRTVPIPPFVKVAIDARTAAAGLSAGPLFRRVRRREYPEKTPAALSERMIWHIVTKYARQSGLVNQLAPHDMRRTCAKLCRESGGDLEQIQFLLGHASIQTTERYLGSRQNLKEAVNDRLGLDE
jgi:site-specific recombinase XerD